MISAAQMAHGGMFTSPQVLAHSGIMSYAVYVPLSVSDIGPFSELLLGVAAYYNKDSSSESVQIRNQESRADGTLMTHTVQEVTPTAASLDLSGVPLGGYILLKNSSDSGTIQYVANVTGVASLLPGEVALFRTSEATANPQVRSDAGTLLLEFWLFSK